MTPRPRLALSRTALFVLILVFLNLQMDGFRLAADVTTNQRRLLPFTLFFCFSLALLLRNDAATLPTTGVSLPTPGTAPRLLHGLAIASLVAALAVFLAAARHYASFGYSLHQPGTLLTFGAAAAFLALGLRSKRPAAPLFVTALLSYLAITLLSIRSFPLTINRSDMLPLLSAAGKVLLHGGNPYRLYTFPSETVYLTYLPGTLLAFLPMTLLHLDLRLFDCVCVLLLAVVLYRAVASPFRYLAAALLALWLLSPYLLYRHELYTEPHWLALISALVLLRRGRVVLAALLFGVSISLSQFSWILFPFFLLHLLHRWGWRAALRAAACSLLAAAVIVLPFVLWSPHAFAVGVLSHWQTQQVAARPVNVSFWLARLVGAPHLQWAQTAFLLVLFLACVRTQSCRSFPGLLRALCLALAGFILGNILVWGYFFLLLELLLLLYLFAANGWLLPSSPAEPPALDRSFPALSSLPHES